MLKKIQVMTILLAALLFAASCKELKRSNPYDPKADGWVGVTYKGEQWYPDNTDIKDMAFENGTVYLGVFTTYSGIGDCVAKITGANSVEFLGATGDIPGMFRDITSVCSDGAGNVYVADEKPRIQTIDSAGSMSYFAVTCTTAIDTLHIEYLSGHIYVANNSDYKILKYTTAGVYVDSKTITCTTYGYFQPGKVIAANGYISVVNALAKNTVVLFDAALNIIDTRQFAKDITDGCAQKSNTQLLFDTYLQRTTATLGSAYQWGDFGDGPGRVLSGRLAVCDQAANDIYVLDNKTIKIFNVIWP